MESSFHLKSNCDFVQIHQFLLYSHILVYIFGGRLALFKKSRHETSDVVSIANNVLYTLSVGRLCAAARA